ncbi:MAG: molybdenum cofactor guanylyltransferase MobA [Alphaproteobacteria bacterium]|nr:molybdenum cofactor guanylyltransferase MobA [Alphaproteobacteria bacterium]
MNILGVILAGGQARRLGGGDKALKELGGRPMLTHAIERLAPQVGQVVVNANGDPARFDSFRVPVIADTVEGFVGPLAGVLAGMEWALVNAPEYDWIATVATDAPFFPEDLVARLAEAVADDAADLACAESNGRAHPVFGFWPVSLAGDLRCALVDEKVRKVDAWTKRFRLARVQFPIENVDPFFNINRPEDMAEAAALFTSAKTATKV